jgi:hypothetical protein
MTYRHRWAAGCRQDAHRGLRGALARSFGPDRQPPDERPTPRPQSKSTVSRPRPVESERRRSSSCGAHRRPLEGPSTGTPPARARPLVREKWQGVGPAIKLLRRASWFVDDRLVPEREDLFAYYAGQDEGQRLFRSAHNRLELLRTRELLQRQLPLPPAVVLDVGGGTGVHAAWLAGRGYRVHLVDVVRSMSEPQLSTGW